MAASVRIKVHDNMEVELTLEATMTKGEWMKLRDQLEPKGMRLHPASTFLCAVDRAIAAAEKHFDGEFRNMGDL